MNTSLKWIKALVPGLDCGVQEYVDAMTLSGSKVEGYEQLDADLDKIVVGQVTKIEKHPDADKLVICQVNVGSETLQIVTGAPNVFEVGIDYTAKNQPDLTCIRNLSIFSADKKSFLFIVKICFCCLSIDFISSF